MLNVAIRKLEITYVAYLYFYCFLVPWMQGLYFIYFIYIYIFFFLYLALYLGVIQIICFMKQWARQWLLRLLLTRAQISLHIMNKSQNNSGLNNLEVYFSQERSSERGNWGLQGGSIHLWRPWALSSFLHLRLRFSDMIIRHRIANDAKINYK